MSSTSRAAGFSLLEMVVTLAVVGVGLGLAAGLLVEGHRIAAQAGLEIRTPEVEGPLALLRNELRSASAIGAGGAVGAWSRDRLELRGPGGEPVVYERRGSRLVRRVGEEGAVRTVVPDLVSWRWFRTAPRLLTVEVVYDPGWGAPGGIVAPGRRRIAGPRSWRTRRFVVALRGTGTDRGW